VNRGLGRGERRRESVGGRVERRSVGMSGSPDLTDEHRQKTQGGVRAPSSGCVVRRKARCGRGTGAVMATGFYEGSLPREGTPGHREASLFNEAVWIVALAAPSPSDPSKRPNKVATRLHARRRVSARTRRRGDRGVRGRLHRAPWEETPTLVTRNREVDGARLACSMSIRRSGSGVVKRPIPRSCRAEP